MADDDGLGVEEWEIPFKDLEFGRLVGKGNFGCVWEGEYVGAYIEPNGYIKKTPGWEGLHFLHLGDGNLERKMTCLSPLVGTAVAIKKVEQQGVENLPPEYVLDKETAFKYFQRELSVLKYALLFFSSLHPSLVKTSIACHFFSFGVLPLSVTPLCL